MTQFALLIGCNYAGTGSDLSGCINDVLNMKEYLLSKGCLQSNITLMTDDTTITTEQTNLPTKANIFQNISKIIGMMKAGDTLVFHMSSHGGQTYDYSGDEKDRRDETLYDMKLQPILDDELKANLVNKIPKGCKLRCIVDACHSATSMDLPWIVTSVNMKYSKESTTCLLSDDVVCISGCGDLQTSADTIDSSGKFAGALTMNILEALKEAGKGETWFELITVVRYLLRKGKYSQVPQLALGRQKLEKTVVDL